MSIRVGDANDVGQRGGARGLLEVLVGRELEEEADDERDVLARELDGRVHELIEELHGLDALLLIVLHQSLAHGNQAAQQLAEHLLHVVQNDEEPMSRCGHACALSIENGHPYIKSHDCTTQKQKPVLVQNRRAADAMPHTNSACSKCGSSWERVLQSKWWFGSQVSAQVIDQS